MAHSGVSGRRSWYVEFVEQVAYADVADVAAVADTNVTSIETESQIAGSGNLDEVGEHGSCAF